MAAKKKPVTRKATRRRDTAMTAAQVRDRVRDLSTKALRDRELSTRDLSRFVSDAFEGALDGLDDSVPPKSVLRDVFEGLRQGVNAAASAGNATAADLRRRGRAVAEHDLPNAADRIRAANDEFLSAVESFASKAARHVREELDTLVARARRTGPKVTESVRSAADAADGRWLELAEETGRATVRAARRGASAVVMGAGGLLEGLAEALAGASRPARLAAKPASRAASSKRTNRKASRKKTATKTRAKSKTVKASSSKPARKKPRASKPRSTKTATRSAAGPTPPAAGGSTPPSE